MERTFRGERASTGRAVGELEERSSVDADLLPGDVAGLVAGQEERQVGDVLGLYVGDGHRLEEVKCRFRVLAGGVLEVGTEHLVEALVVQQMSVAIGGVDRVD